MRIPMQYAVGTKSASGDNELIAAPGTGKRIVIGGLLVQNESATATTVVLTSGGNSLMRALLPAQGDGVVRDMERGWQLDENDPLTLNLSGANSHGYSVAYWVEEIGL